MNLGLALEIYAGGPGSGCTGQNCGRPQGAGIQRAVNTEAEGIVYGDERGAADKFDITDQAGAQIGKMFVRKTGTDLTIRWVQVKGGQGALGAVNVRAVLRALLKEYPGTQTVNGERVTGTHGKREGNYHVKVAVHGAVDLEEDATEEVAVR